MEHAAGVWRGARTALLLSESLSDLGAALREVDARAAKHLEGIAAPLAHLEQLDTPTTVSFCHRARVLREYTLQDLLARLAELAGEATIAAPGVEWASDEEEGDEEPHEEREEEALAHLALLEVQRRVAAARGDTEAVSISLGPACP